MAQSAYLTPPRPQGFSRFGQTGNVGGLFPWQQGTPMSQPPALQNTFRGAPSTEMAPWQQQLGKRFGGGRLGAAGTLNDILGRGRSAGFFDPMGSDAINRRLEQGAIRSSDAAIQRGRTLAALAGLDPSAARATLAGIEGQNADRTARFLSDAQLQELMGNRDWLRQLFSGKLDFERQLQLAKMAQDAQGGGFGDFLGSILGTGLGAFTGGAGTKLAGKLIPG